MLSNTYVKRSAKTTSFDFNSFLDDGLKMMVLEKKISQNFSNEIKEITKSGASYPELQDKINILKKSDLSSDEQNFLMTYESTLSASNRYWNLGNSITNKNQPKPKNNDTKCSSDVIVADALGAALGLFGSPVWSIIQGAVVSVAVNEDCPN